MRSTANASKLPAPTLHEAAVYFLRLLFLVRAYWGGLLRGLLLGIAIGLLGLIPPYLGKLYFDSVYPSRDFSLLHVLVIGVAMLSIGLALMNGLRSYFTQVVATRLSSAL